MGNDEFNTLEDLVFSRSFRSWVLKGTDTPEAGFWAAWQEQHPEKLALINQAKAVIYALQLHLRPLSEETIDQEIQKVLARLDEGHIDRSFERPYRRRPTRIMAAIGIFTGICFLLLSISLYLHRHQDPFHSFLSANAKSAMHQQTGEVHAENVLILPDGSTVRLDPGSKLFYPEGLTGDRRQVFLQGTAFFDIAHNANHPFYVYTNTIITKVLGTSFRVATTEKHTTVTVTSGKVSVYHKPDLSDGIILTPNQQITYDPNEDRLDRTIASQPIRLAGTGDTTLVFNATPLPTVFHRLQSIYGIPILYDEESVSGCSLSVTMGEESFYDKLNIICKAIGGSYESIDGTIVITARGCK